MTSISAAEATFQAAQTANPVFIYSSQGRSFQPKFAAAGLNVTG
ncbi:hypothetical protein [Simiduia sp. 21SJ11W-1]|nr:hypothetical protein [Simiduia sp. 21SJ11W-1]